MSRQVVIYCRGDSSNSEARQLQGVAQARGWIVSKVFANRQPARGGEWEALWRLIGSSDVNLLAIPSLSTLADSAPDALREILRLHESGCDLYVADADLDTTSPVDRVLFRVAAALSALGDGQAEHRDQQRPRRPRTAPQPTPPGQRSLITAALATGMAPRQVAKSLKVPLELVRAVQTGKAG